MQEGDFVEGAEEVYKDTLNQMAFAVRRDGQTGIIFSGTSKVEGRPNRIL